MRVPIRLVCALLVLVATVIRVLGAEQSSVPLEGPAFGAETVFEKPELSWLAVDTEPVALGLIGAGSEQRVDGAYVVERRSGELIDGVAAVGLRRVHPARRAITVGTLTLFGGTDALAAREGRFLGGASIAQGSWRGLFPIYDIRLDGGWSTERKTVLGADAIVGPLHLGLARDRFARSYRAGGALDAPPGLLPVRLGVDRVVGFRNGSRDLATETWLELTVPLGDGVFLSGHGSYTRHAVDGLGNIDAVWEGWAGIGVRW